MSTKTELKRVAAVPEHDTEVTIIACSFCGTVAESGGLFDNRPEWPTGYYDLDETGIYWRTGQHFPEGGDGYSLRIHACPACFLEKVVPALENAGAKFEKVEWYT